MPARQDIETCGGDSMASFLMGQMTQGCAERLWLVLRNPVPAGHHELPIRILRARQLEGHATN